jgi:hypothetical protein
MKIFKGDERLAFAAVRKEAQAFQEILHALCEGKPDAQQFQAAGKKWEPQVHFHSMFPFTNLVPGQLQAAKPYWDDMLNVLTPARCANIVAWWLQEVMTPGLDFSLELQFGDPIVANAVLAEFAKDEEDDDE